MKSRIVLSRILFVLYLIAIAFLLFATSDQLPNIKKSLLGIQTDKVAHFLMFTPFPILAFLSTDIVSKKWWHSVLAVLIIFVVGAAIAAFTEYVQGLTDYRVADIEDFKADLLGMTLTSVIVLVVDMAKLPKKSRR